MADEEEPVPTTEEAVPEEDSPKRGLVWEDLSEEQLQLFVDCDDAAEKIR